MVEIQGKSDAKFAKLKDLFATCFSDHNEHGASVAVFLEGKLVAEFWGGYADKAKTKAWKQDTLVNVWSCTKGVVATAVAMAVERGKLAYEVPIAKVWPEFAGQGKAKISLDLAMSHRAGLNGFAKGFQEATLFDYAATCASIAGMAPHYEPGTHCAYHALTYGHLAAEPLRRATGKGIGAFISSEIAAPLGADFFVGVPEAMDHRCAEMIVGKGCNDWLAQVQGSKFPQSCFDPTPRALIANERRWRAAEIPGGNGFGTAKGLASIYGNLASGKSKLLGKAGLAAATALRFRGQDEGFEDAAVWAAGYRLDDPGAYGAKASSKSFGHGGWGGAIGFADPDAKLGFAYVTNHMMGFDGDDPRRKKLSEAVYEAL